MKNTSYILKITAAAAILATAFGCVREELDAPEASGKKFTLEVGLAPQVKTYLGEKEGTARKVYWSNGDQISANGKTSEALENLTEGTQSTVFTFSEQNNPGSYPFNVLYPASAFVDASHITLPAIQDYKAGSFADGMSPMAGISTDGSSLTLSHLCAVLHISIKRSSAVDADTDNIVSVSFKGKNSEQVSGSFGINYSTATLTSNSSAAADKEVKVVKSQATSTETAVEYYLVVPAGTYPSGFEVIVQDANGDTMTKSKTTSGTSSSELFAGKLYNMAVADFVPNGAATGIEIASAEDLIAFATAYNSKQYDALGSSLVATVTQNITFDATTSAAFNATGGIGLKNNIHGTEDYYFNGVIKGNNHTISGLSATVPLFTATSANCKISDLTINSDCSFTFTHANNTQGQFGAIVGYHKGLLKNVDVNASMSLAACNVDYETAFGGIAGRVVEGTLDNCTFAGSMVIPSDYVVSGKLTYIGGLAGYISNAAGVIKDSAFNGTIENEGQVSSSDSTLPYLIIGGILGRNSGTISNCTAANHATGVTLTVTDSSDHNYTGTIVTHSTLAYHYSLAGICGDNRGTITGCTNYANLLNSFSTARGTDDVNGRYLEIGGIVGFNYTGAVVSNCDNYASIIDRANPKMHYVGGIVGRNYKGTVSSCDNKSGANFSIGTSHGSPYGVRQLMLGGVIGWNDAESTVSNVHNAANLTVSRLEGSTATFSYIGGVIGRSTEAIDGSSNGGTITNSGTIAQTSGIGMINAPTETADQGIFLGGIIGHTTKSVKNVSNTGKITYTCTAAGIGARYVQMGGVVGKVNAASTVDVEHCTNTANVTFVVSTADDTNATHKANANTRYYYNYLGGIVGNANNVAIKGDASSKCTNSGVIKGGDGSDNNNQASPSFTIGGIVGYISGESSISYCSLTGSGQAYNDHWSNRTATFYAPACGGIAGHVFGTSESNISLTNCDVANTASVTGRRGSLGGVVGIAQYAEISNCTVPINFTGQSGYYYGGIAGQAQYSSISSSIYSGTTIQSSQLAKGGGIVGDFLAGSTIDGCSSYASTINKNGAAVTTTGGIAGSSVAGAIIKNCHYSSSGIAICGDANFTNDGSNVADL